MKIWSTISLILSYSSVCNSKTVSDSFRLSGVSTEALITKFALSPKANGNVKVKFHSDQLHPYPSRITDLHVYFYSSEQTWRTVKDAPTCQEKIRYASKQQALMFSPQHKGHKKKYDRKDLMSLPNDGEVDWISELDSVVRDESGPVSLTPEYWYIMVADCALEQRYLDNKIPTLYYTLEIMDELSPNVYTHLSHDEQGLTSLHFLNSILSLFISAWLFSQIFSRHYKRQELHLSILLVFAASVVHAVSSLCQMIHLQIYARNGIGSYTADFVSAHAEALVDSLLCWIMLAVAVGWTLPVDLKQSSSSKTASSTNAKALLYYIQSGFQSSSRAAIYQNPAFQLLAWLEIIHAIFCQWGRTYNDDFDCYHDLEHLPGRILLGFRLILSMLFLIFTATLTQQCHARHPSLVPFIQKFRLIGASWFVSLPSLALLVSSSSSHVGSVFHIPAHRRHPIMTTLGMALQVVSLMSLGWLFTGTEDASSYHRVNNVNDTSMGGLGTFQASSNFSQTASTSTGTSVVGSGSGAGADAGAGGRSVFKFGKTKVRLD